MHRYVLFRDRGLQRDRACIGLNPRQRRASNSGRRILRYNAKLVPFDPCGSLPNAIELRPIIHLSGPLDGRKRDHTLSGYPGTRWTGSGPLKIWVTGWRVRARPPEFGGYPFVAGTRRVSPLPWRVFVTPGQQIARPCLDEAIALARFPLWTR